MKRTFLMAVLASTILTGCGTPSVPASLSDLERKEVAEGKQVRFLDYRPAKGSLRLEKNKLPNGVFVCASAWPFPTDQCYPFMGELVGQYLSDRGIPVVKEQAAADITLYFNAAFWYEGRMPDKNFTYALETSLAKGGLEIKDQKGAGIETGVALAAGKAMQLGGLALFGGLMSSGGGYWADRHWVSITMIEVVNKSSIIQSKGVWSNKPEQLHSFEFAGRYIGPVKANESSVKLFGQAMNEALDQMVIR